MFERLPRAQHCALYNVIYTLAHFSSTVSVSGNSCFLRCDPETQKVGPISHSCLMEARRLKPRASGSKTQVSTSSRIWRQASIVKWRRSYKTVPLVRQLLVPLDSFKKKKSVGSFFTSERQSQAEIAIRAGNALIVEATQGLKMSPDRCGSDRWSSCHLPLLWWGGRFVQRTQESEGSRGILWVSGTSQLTYVSPLLTQRFLSKTC